VTYETVRQWGKKFGKAFADQIRQRAPEDLLRPSFARAFAH
jgi:transposase-like protein